MESPLSPHSAHHISPSQALPSISSLTHGLPPTSQHSPQAMQHPARDSGAWVNPQSKHTSVNSGLHVSTLLNPDDRNSIPSTPTSTRHSQHNTTLPSINQGFEPHSQREGHAHRQSVDYYAAQDSRRSSADSRGFNFGLNSTQSPYESQHASQVSLAANLRRPDAQSQYSPESRRAIQRSIEQEKTRTAPPIVPNPRQYGAPDPMASRPTQGFPWAFPDSAGPAPEERAKRRASSSESSESNKMSRQGSYAASSVRSSVLSGDQHLPPGQRRFEDGMGFQKIIGTVSHESEPPTSSPLTHHHQMQHKSVTQLQNEHGMNTPGGYSRTPELRVSHKLAERKRRSEMKDLFEDLNKAVPANGGAKASKWEILSKAIDYIRSSREREQAFHEEMLRLRGELEYARELQNENDQLRTEANVMFERLTRLEPDTRHVYGAFTAHLSNPQSQNNAQAGQQHGHLPPMSSSHPHEQQHHHHPHHNQHNQHNQHPPTSSYNSLPHSAPMQGVEYALPTRPGYETSR